MCRRLQCIATALLALAVYQAFAEENDPARPAPARTEATDPNASTKSDKAKPRSFDPNEAGPSNSAPAPSTNSPAPKPKPETLAERTARLTKLLRYEINGDTRRILDTTFSYPKKVAGLEADFDKCLADERYADGEKIALELVPLLPRGVQVFFLGEMRTLDYAALAKAWTFEAELCRRADSGQFGNGPDRRRGVALARLRQVCEMAEMWKPDEADDFPILASGRSARALNSNENARPSLAYLLLRAMKFADRQSVDVEETITRTLNLMLDRVRVELPTQTADVPAGALLRESNLRGLVSLKLKDTPDDALLMRDLQDLPTNQRFTITRLVAGMPIRRSQLGNADTAQIVRQKVDDAAIQDRIHSSLKQLFPSETIEVHVVRNTAILRANLRKPVHELQIVAVAQSLAPNVLNQMTVNSDDTDRVATVEEKLEPIGDDPHGLREILARLYPKEHIEAHVLPVNSAVVLRGHLSRPEYAQQVYDIAVTSYATVLYQMTPPLPAKPAQLKTASAKTSSAREVAPSAGDDFGGIEVSDLRSRVIPLNRISDDEVVRLLQPKFAGKATIERDEHTNAVKVFAKPVVIKDVHAAVMKLDELGAPTAVSTAPIDSQEAAMDREARQLATKFRTAKLGEQQGLRRQLEQLTERHFEQRQQRRQREIDDLAHRIDKLRVTHHRRQENKAAVIQQRVQDLLDPNADLRWDEPRTNEVSKTDGFKGVGNAHPTDATGGKRLEPDAFELDNDGHTKRFVIFAVLPDRGFLDEPLDIRYSMAVPKGSDATDIVVEETIPDGTEFFGALPREAELKDGKLTWRFGDLKRGTVTSFMMRIVPRKCLTLTSQIRATSSSLGEATNPHRNKTLVVEVATSSRSAEAQSANEPTFDGTSYSQWLKMLETERKPEKLAAAILACSRLVVKGDERRIVRGIFAAARLFDATESAKERSTVWNASYDALWRLLSEGVPDMGESTAEELLTHIGDARFAESPGFVMEFFSSLLRGKIKLSKALQAHAPAWVAALVRHDSVSAKFDPRLAVAASSLWMVSRTPIDDFEGLRPLVLKGYDAHVSGAHYSSTWSAIQTAEYATEVPEIVQILAKHIDKNPDYFVDVLGDLGPAAEPAVPRLVEHCLSIWKQREDELRELAGGKSPYTLGGNRDFSEQRKNILKALQKIGPGAKQAIPLLKELISIAPHKEKNPDQAEVAYEFWDELNKTLLAIGDTPDKSPAKSKPLLSEFSHLATTWKLTASRPGQTIPRVTLHIGGDFRFGLQDEGSMFAVLELLGCHTSAPNFTLDETANPKQITLLDKDKKAYQQFGICELKGDRLKIEFAKPGLPRPKEFSSDRDKLPEGHILLEFERDRGEETP
ncbi:MAG: hypothetical protein AABP62_17765 [Planctomycetota bacterium]